MISLLLSDKMKQSKTLCIKEVEGCFYLILLQKLDYKYFSTYHMEMQISHSI